MLWNAEYYCVCVIEFKHDMLVGHVWLFIDRGKIWYLNLGNIEHGV